MPTSTPSSPVQGRQRKSRRPSTLKNSSASPSPYTSHDFSPLSSPRTSRSSIQTSPVTPRHAPKPKMSRTASMSSDIAPDPALQDGGLGSLADELAEAWGEEESYEQNSSLVEGASPSKYRSDLADMHDFGLGNTLGSVKSPTAQSTGSRADGALLSPVFSRRLNKARKGHHRSESQYDGSDYGNDSDLEEPEGIPRGLLARMSDIEALARRGISEPTMDGISPIDSAVASLKDLGGQSTVENSATRLMTAHTSLTSHLTHQTRSVQTLTHPLLNTVYPTMPAETISELLSLVDALLPTLPYAPQPNPLLSFQILISNTADLIHTLRSLSDTLQESRQITSTASRRLKTVKDLVAEIRRDEEDREVGVRWIESGSWDRRVRDKEAKRICGEVVEGFENACDMWRSRLLNSVAEVNA
ncbi:MAG: hypothetical protein Q9227_005354 [Pyrenula ochraceoflavens]